MPKRSRKLPAATSVLLIAFLSFPLTVSAQSADTSGEIDGRELIAKLGELAHEFVDPNIELLRKKSLDDNELQHALSRIQLYVRPRPFGQGAAEASRRSTRDLIVIDQGLVNEGLYISNLVTLRMASRTDWSVIQRDVLDSYAERVDAARVTSSIVPHFTFDESPYLTDDMQREAMKRYSLQVSKSVFAWMVLHEVAHHVIGHTSHASTSAQYEREELEADRWAFTTMTRLGLPLWGVYDYLTLMESLTEVRVAHGAGLAADATFWGQRANRLASEFNLNAQPEAKLIAFLGVVEWTDLQDGSSSPKHIQLYLPKECNASHWYGMVNGSVPGLRGILACEEQNGQKVLYARAQNVTNKIVVHTPRNLDSIITFEVAANGQPVSRFSYDAIFVEHSLAVSGSQPDAETGVSMLDVFGADPVSIATRPLTLMSISPDVKSSAEHLIRRCASNQGKLFINYMKGLGTESEFAQNSQLRQIRCATELQQTLGASGYQRYQQELLGDPMVRYGINQLTGQSTGN